MTRPSIIHVREGFARCALLLNPYGPRVSAMAYLNCLIGQAAFARNADACIEPTQRCQESRKRTTPAAIGEKWSVGPFSLPNRRSGGPLAQKEVPIWRRKPGFLVPAELRHETSSVRCTKPPAHRSPPRSSAGSQNSTQSGQRSAAARPTTVGRSVTPLIEAMKPGFQTELARTPSRSALAEAIRYALARWEELSLPRPRLHRSRQQPCRTGHPTGRARPQELSVAGSDGGGIRSPTACSLIATAKLNDVVRLTQKRP